MRGICSIAFIKDYRCFKIGDYIEFKDGLNLLVGDQGTGKSTLLDILRHSRDYRDIVELEIPTPVQIGGFDFEKANPRTQAAFGGVDGKMPVEFQVQSMWMSHGEVNKAILSALTAAKDAVYVLDEPDQALSIRSLWGLCQTLDKGVKSNIQFIASVHNPIVIMHAKEVYSLEHRKWMTGADFIQSQKEPRNVRQEEEWVPLT